MELLDGLLLVKELQHRLRSRPRPSLADSAMVTGTTEALIAAGGS